MTKLPWQSLLVFPLLLCVLILSIGDAPAQAAPAAQDTPNLNTAVVTGTVVLPGRAIIDARSNHLVVDSPGALAGPNQEVNPLELLLGALNTCATFLYEAAAKEMNIPLDHISAVTEGDFAAQGLKDGSVNPRIRAFRIKINLRNGDYPPGYDEVSALRAQFKKRCPIYTTLSLAAPIDIIHVGRDDEVGAPLAINFKYTVPTADFRTAAYALSKEFFAINQLYWMIWALNEENHEFSGTLQFFDAAERDAFLQSDLLKTITTDPMFSDVVVTPYAVMARESRVTNMPFLSQPVHLTADEAGVLLRINYAYNVPTVDFMAAVSPLAEQFAAVEGLQWKLWGVDEASSTFSGLLYFDNEAALQAFLESNLAAIVMGHPALSDFTITPFQIMLDASARTRYR